MSTTAATAADTVLARRIKAMSEADLEGNVAGACKTLGLRYYHTHRSQHSPAGFPDDFILGPTRLIVRELKRESGKTTPEQQDWLDGLAAIGVDAGVWRPSDWHSGLIVAELRALKRGQPSPSSPTRR